MTRIKAICKTNLDGYTCPITSFVAIPNMGNRVDVLKEGREATLKVVAITHKEKIITPAIASPTVNHAATTEPYIEVELNH